MRQRNIIILKIITWLACFVPLADMLVRGWGSYRHTEPDLGANPVEYITLSTGTATLVLLLCSLAVTPLRRLSNWAWLIRFRRLLGLFAFFYGTLHLIIYFALDREFDWSSTWADIMKRPFITMGMLSFILMVPLAITSTSWAIRKMGGSRWNALHKLVYVSGVAAIIHFWWKVKKDHTEPAFYGMILLVLFAARIVWWIKESRKKNNSQPSASAAVQPQA